ncbi:hypothetical protein Tco_1144284 [Tanacetum coccineum]
MKKDPKTPLLVGRGFVATTNVVIDCRMAKIAVGEGIAMSVFDVKGVDLDCYLPEEWDIARNAEINPFKDVLVFRRMFCDTHRIRNEVKKERLEAFVAAVNNNNNTSHIAYLEDGCDVCQVLTESGILTRVKKDVSGLAPALFQFIDGRRR